LAAATATPAALFAEEPAVRLRIGLVTDLHYADKPTAGTRHYRDTAGKLAEAAAQFQKDKIDLVVELGDFIDAADSVDVEKQYLKSINGEFSKIARDRHYVLGNHCVDTLTKPEFLDAVEQEKSYYSFDRAGCHFVVLDACFRSDGQPYGRKNSQWTDANIVKEELDWLQADLKQVTGDVIVFVHQRLDVSNNHGVKNGADVRKVLEASGKVRAVFQGHSHQNDLKEVGGIPYCTLVAMVEGVGPESNGYSQLSLDEKGTLRVSGFRNQKGYQWGRNS
jgi:alkaline phosphatase